MCRQRRAALRHRAIGAGIIGVVTAGGRIVASLAVVALLTACSESEPRETLPDAVRISRRYATETVREVEEGHRVDKVVSKLVTAEAYASAAAPGQPDSSEPFPEEGPYSWYWVLFATGDFFDEHNNHYPAAIHLVDAVSGEHIITEPQESGEAPRFFAALRDEARAATR